jgi:hypothetical protein
MVAKKSWVPGTSPGMTKAGYTCAGATFAGSTNWWPGAAW